MTQTHSAAPWNQRFRGWFRRHWLLDTAWRITVFVVGVTLMCVGVMLLVLPGPGWAMIALGLIVLASEYVWAQRLLAPVRQKLRAAKAKAQNPQYRTQVRALSAGAVVLMAAAAGAYLWRYGLTLDGVRGMWPL
ncbi:MAG: PGPGW domain-containing protein [Micrococcales bacterium]|nr:PGPGW domain-containing protein [Micrococcales bacterium]